MKSQNCLIQKTLEGDPLTKRRKTWTDYFVHEDLNALFLTGPPGQRVPGFQDAIRKRATQILETSLLPDDIDGILRL